MTFGDILSALQALGLLQPLQLMIFAMVVIALVRYFLDRV